MRVGIALRSTNVSLERKIGPNTINDKLKHYRSDGTLLTISKK